MTPVLFAVAFSFTAQVPANWSCDDALFADDTCDCGCAVADDDCDLGGFEVCVRDNCPDGQVPWADNNASCMAGTCGDGWKADDEACDEGNTGADGGCNADCSAVNEGSVCGEGASGCVGAVTPTPPAAPLRGLRHRSLVCCWPSLVAGERRPWSAEDASQ